MRYTAAFLALVVAIPSAAADPDQRKRDHDHVGDFCFSVEIQNVSVGSFRAVEGLGANAEVVEMSAGGEASLRLRPGRKKFGDIVLRRQKGSATELERQWQQLREGKYDRRDITVATDTSCALEYPYTLFPAQWTISTVTEPSGGSDLLQEEVTLEVEEIKFR